MDNEQRIRLGQVMVHGYRDLTPNPDEDELIKDALMSLLHYAADQDTGEPLQELCNKAVQGVNDEIWEQHLTNQEKTDG